MDSPETRDLQVAKAYLREGLIKNAVNFLSDPRVKDSPLEQRRSFLLGKGLSNQEVEEALRRAMTNLEDASPEHAAAKGEYMLKEPLILNKPLVVRTSTRPFWSRVAMTVGFIVVACTGTGLLFKRLVVRKVKLWIRGLLFEEEAFQARTSKAKQLEMDAISVVKAASTAANASATASQGMTKLLTQERLYMSDVIQALESHTIQLTRTIKAIRGVMEARGTQKQISFPKAAPQNKLSDVRKSPGTLDNMILTTATSASNNIDKHLQTRQSNKPDHAPHSASFLEVMAMLERGETPPGIQEINDKPPNPNQAPSISRLQRKPKPWEIANKSNDNSSKLFASNDILKADRSLTVSSAEDKGVISSTSVSSTQIAEYEETKQRHVVEYMQNNSAPITTEIYVDGTQGDKSKELVASEELQVMNEIAILREEENNIEQSSIKQDENQASQPDNGSQRTSVEIDDAEDSRDSLARDQETPNVHKPSETLLEANVNGDVFNASSNKMGVEGEVKDSIIPFEKKVEEEITDKSLIEVDLSSHVLPVEGDVYSEQKEVMSETENGSQQNNIEIHDAEGGDREIPNVHKAFETPLEANVNGDVFNVSSSRMGVEGEVKDSIIPFEKKGEEEITDKSLIEVDFNSHVLPAEGEVHSEQKEVMSERENGSQRNNIEILHDAEAGDRETPNVHKPFETPVKEDVNGDVFNASSSKTDVECEVKDSFIPYEKKGEEEITDKSHVLPNEGDVPENVTRKEENVTIINEVENETGLSALEQLNISREGSNNIDIGTDDVSIEQDDQTQIFNGSMDTVNKDESSNKQDGRAQVFDGDLDMTTK